LLSRAQAASSVNATRPISPRLGDRELDVVVV
jgi:hypothetical protein